MTMTILVTVGMVLLAMLLLWSICSLMNSGYILDMVVAWYLLGFFFQLVGAILEGINEAGS
jgi:hypothetical protein